MCIAARLIWQLVIHSCVIFLISRRDGENNGFLAGVPLLPPPSRVVSRPNSLPLRKPALPACRSLLFPLLHAEKVPFPRATKEIADVCTQASEHTAYYPGHTTHRKGKMYAKANCNHWSARLCVCWFNEFLWRVLAKLQFSQCIACHSRAGALCSYFYGISLSLMESCTFNAL